MASIVKAASRAASLVDRHEAEARERARALAAEAEEWASRTRSAVAAERVAALQAAARAGREEGLASAAAALLAVAETRRRRLEGLEHEIACVALEVARKLLGRTLVEHPEAVVDLARQALAAVRSRREVVLRVNAADAPLLRAEQPALCALLERAPGIGIREDPALERGGVVVETEAGRVDARVEAQLELVERAVREEPP